MRKLFVIFGLFFFLGCCFFAGNFFVEAKKEPPLKYRPVPAQVAAEAEVKPASDSASPFISGTEKKLMDAGLVNIKKLDSSIIVDLKYSTNDNFLYTDVYGDLNNAYLQKDVAEKLRMAQRLLKARFSYYSLIVYDAVRPRSIQEKMWDSIDVPLRERSKYVSNPQNGSLHNYGAAVDLSIMDENGIALDMGTPYDYFGELAYPREEQRMIAEGKLTYKQLYNRQILREIMQQAGFSGITTEWWHFNSCSRTVAAARYEIVE